MRAKNVLLRIRWRLLKDSNKGDKPFKILLNVDDVNKNFRVHLKA